MKIFIEKHEAVIDGWFKPTKEAKQGEIIPHHKTVSKVYFYQKQYINEQESFAKIELTKEMILDLADNIKAIESEVVEMPFDEMPW